MARPEGGASEMCSCVVCTERRETDRAAKAARQTELNELRRELELCGLGDRPQSMAAQKLRRLIVLEREEARDRG